MKAEGELRLTEPTADLAGEFLAFARERLEEGQKAYAAPLADLDAYLRSLERSRDGIDLPPDRVPSRVYWLLADEAKIVATCRFRPRLVPHLVKEGGHIGYDVRPSERRKGYGTALLALVLEKARAEGLTEVLVTCDEDNVGSAKIIERNGGLLLNRVVSDRSGKVVNRYRLVIGDRVPDEEESD